MYAGLTGFVVDDVTVKKVSSSPSLGVDDPAFIQECSFGGGAELHSCPPLRYPRMTWHRSRHLLKEGRRSPVVYNIVEHMG